MTTPFPFAVCSRVALAAALLVPALGRAHIAEFTATLDTAQEVPTPTGTAPGAGGSGEFLLEDDGTVEATVPFQDLTGQPLAAHIHQGPVGTAGGIITGFAAALASVTGPAGTIAGVGDAALSEAQQQTMFAGGMYFNVHTMKNQAGEIRGQIRLKPGACPCDTATSSQAFKQCVKQQIKSADKSERKEEPVKLLKKLYTKAACGKTKTPKKTVACCLPISPALNIVTDRMCAAVKEKQCVRLKGTSLGAGSSCVPTNPCRIGSPSGAFVAGPAS